MRQRRVVLASLALLGLAACSSDAGSSTATVSPATEAPTTSAAPATTAAATTTVEATTTEAPTTTVDPAALAEAYSEPGPYAVGVMTFTLSKGNQVEIWYPVAEGTATTDISYDVRDFTPPAIRDILTADIPASYSFTGARDAAIADGQFPVVLFSHGFTGIRLQSTFLTAHLASWGMIVASPEHPSRDLTNVLAGSATGDRADSVDDLLKTLDLVIAQGDDAGVFAGHVDADHVVAVGHSAGGGTVLGAAEDDRVDGYVSMASGVVLGGGSDPNATTTTSPTQLPDKPSFFLGGSVDAVVPVATVTEPSFESVPSPSLLWVLDGVGHNGFDDFCTFGNGTGIIGVAEASGLGGLLDAQPQLRALGEDGCIPPAVPVTETFPAIRHAVTAWIRALFGIDATPVGLGPDVAGDYAVAVTITERP